MTAESSGTPLDKTFDPAAIEARWYAHWEDNGLFRPERPNAQPFTIVNPPPNVTGSLHIGHALDNTLQDIVIRYERLRGKDALWVVGTDHAGIATQMVVERQLEAAGDKRTHYTREAFVDKVWEWKGESGGQITRQLRRLGCSMDWSREQFTMDPHFTRAVLKVFVEEYNAGLIYRDKRLVNWDPKLKTAISDLEVETREVQGQFWHFRYPLEPGVTLADGRDHIVVATTRPETMLADMAVAVNGADERYRSVIGKHVVLPITGRRVPIVADEHADPELGSGAVKITPGHDFNDFEVGRRAGIRAADMLNMLDAEARVVQTADGLIPAEFIGLDRFEARRRVVERLDAEGLLAQVEDRTIQTPYGDRGGVVIEPWLTDQWYVDAAKLAQAPIEAVRSGAIEIVPKSWEKTFFNWMENIQPWCISRQLWWGHRIPAWYGPVKGDGWLDTYELRAFVAETEEEVLKLAAEYYGRDDLAVVEDRQAMLAHVMSEATTVPLFRDPDVLDTWFSSALWPFATLGWPESSPSSDGEGDQPQAGGGVSYKLPPRTNASVLRAKAMRRDMSPAEAMLWRALKERPDGLKFRRQHPAGDYVLDFFCPAAALAIEVDGEAHDRADRPARDAERDAFLLDCGVATLRVPARDALRDPVAAADAIAASARERIPLHQPAAGPPPRLAGEDSLLARHYPNDLLISGFDILFFWDARMAMQGMHLLGEAPWKRLYLHGLVRAADGQKMSKSKGNVVDPLGLIDQYGADALRFFMAAMESQGRDVKMDERRVEGYRNFATKLWNAARFCQSNGIGASETVAAPQATLAVNRWIVGEVVETVAELDRAMAELRFDAAANAIYHFVWDTFCDWYIELVKPVLSKVEGPVLSKVEGPVLSKVEGPVLSPLPPAGGAGGGPAGEADAKGEEPTPSPSREREGNEGSETRAVAGWVLDQILVMLHPFMPFVTEELWNKLGTRPYELIVAQWPEPGAQVDAEAKREVEWLIALISDIRSARAEMNVPPSALTELLVHNDHVVDGFKVQSAPRLDLEERLRANAGVLARLARIDSTHFALSGTAFDNRTGASIDRLTYSFEGKRAIQVVSSDVTYSIPLDGLIDFDAEKARLSKALATSEKERDSLAKRLENPAFVEKAKPEAIDKARADHAAHAAEAERLGAALARLG